VAVTSTGDGLHGRGPPFACGRLARPSRSTMPFAREIATMRPPRQTSRLAPPFAWDLLTERADRGVSLEKLKRREMARRLQWLAMRMSRHRGCPRRERHHSFAAEFRRERDGRAQGRSRKYGGITRMSATGSRPKRRTAHRGLGAPSVEHHGALALGWNVSTSSRRRPSPVGQLTPRRLKCSNVPTERRRAP